MADESQASEQSQETPADSEQKGEEQQAAETLILGRFKSPDDLAEAYKNLEKKLGEQGNELGNLRKLVTQAEATLKAQPQQPQKDPVEQFWEKPTEYVDGRIRSVVEPLHDIVIGQQKEMARGKVKDFDKYEGEIDQILKQYPQLKSQPGIIPNLYRMVKSMHVEDIEAEVREKLKAEEKAKNDSFIEEGSPPGSPQDKPTLSKAEKGIAHKLFPELSKAKAEEEYLRWK